MDSIREGMELTNEISDAISNPMNVGIENDEEELKAQLAELEAEKLDEVLMGADRVPSHVPSGVGLHADCESMGYRMIFASADIFRFSTHHSPEEIRARE